MWIIRLQSLDFCLRSCFRWPYLDMLYLKVLFPYRCLVERVYSQTTSILVSIAPQILLRCIGSRYTCSTNLKWRESFVITQLATPSQRQLSAVHSIAGCRRRFVEIVVPWHWISWEHDASYEFKALLYIAWGRLQTSDSFFMLALVLCNTFSFLVWAIVTSTARSNIVSFLEWGITFFVGKVNRGMSQFDIDFHQNLIIESIKITSI